jgi:hypothetical protein
MVKPRTLPIAITAIAALSCAGMLAMFRPGIAVYDTVKQYEQALSGHYDDWHPPIMARLWAGLEAIGLHGVMPMLVLQLCLFWAGLALVGMALARPRPVLGVAVLAIGLFPIIANWMIVIVKDTQLVAVMTAATGLVVWHRLRGRAMPAWALALVVLLLGYALLVRANSAFAVVPLAWSWLGWAGVRRWWGRALLVLAGLAMVFGLSGPINHRLFRAEPSHVENTLPVFDLAGIAHYAPLDSLPGVPATQWREAVAKACYTPFFWDPFADPAKCGDIGDALTDDDRVPSLKAAWIGAILHHPIAYAEHRLAHLNANLRLFVPEEEQSTAAPPRSQPNDDALGAGKTVAADHLAALTHTMAGTPLGSPFAWVMVAAMLGWALVGAPRQPAREMGLALSLSVGVMTASFAVVSIASDLRYHLWLIVGTLLAAAMAAACEGVPRWRLAIGGGVVLAVCVVEIVARAMLVALPF